jgi:hypothetical protein
MRPWLENLLEKLLPPLTALLALLALALLSAGNGFAQSCHASTISRAGSTAPAMASAASCLCWAKS